MAPPPLVRLSPRGAARLRAGHPWIYRADVPSPASDDADCVLVADERGRAQASAFAAPAPAPIALRIYARGTRFVPFDDILAERLARAAARRAGATVARLVHAEADQLPGLFIDRYGDAAVIQAATGAIDRREAAIARLLVDTLGVTRVLARDDGSMRDHENLPRRKGFLAGGPDAAARFVDDSGIAFSLDLLEDSKTGGFLDQRANHAHAASLARGAVLDAFTYHGGFALPMARRAASVLALEIDPKNAERARANASANGLANVEVRTVNAFVELRALESAGRRFSLVVLDPPALAKRGPVDAALRAYKELNLRALRLVERDGHLVTCSCSGKITPALFEAMLVDAARDAPREAAIIERRGPAPDHPVLLGVPETDYLKCWILRVM